jgi:phage-related protein
VSVELAVAYVSLVPSAQGIGRKIANEIGPPIEAAAKQAGANAGDAVAKSFGDKMAGAGKQLGKIGAATTAAVTLPILAIGKQALDAASDLNESLSKAGVVFGDFTGQVVALAADSATKLGQSRQQVLEAAGTFGNLFVSLGLGQKPAAEMSTSLVKLAADLASFNNVSPDEALDALRSGLVGETEPLRRFGVNMNDVELKAKALALGLGDFSKGVLPPAIKAQAAYALILDQTKTAQGDFARTADGAANKQRILTAQFENAKATLGQALLPIFSQVATVVGKLAERFTHLSPRVQKFVLIGAGIAAAIGPVVGIIGALVAGVGFLLSPVGLAIAAIAALAAGAIYAYRHFQGFRDVVDGVARFMTGTVVPAVTNLVRIFREEGLGGVIAHVGDAIRGALPGILGALKGWAVAFAEWVPGAALGLLHALGDLEVRVGKWLIGEALPGLAEKLGEWAAAFAAWVPGAAIRLVGELAALIIRVAGWIAFEGLPALVAKLLDWQAAFYAWVPGAIAGLIRDLPSIATTVIDFVLGLPQKLLDGAADIGSKMIEIGKKMVGGIVEGLKAARQDILDAIYDVIPGGKDGPLAKVARLSIPGFANGGFLEPGRFGIAGENGKELLFGGKTGVTVMAADATRQLYTRDAAGSTITPAAAAGNTLHFHIDAPLDTDTRAKIEAGARAASWMISPDGRR